LFPLCFAQPTDDGLVPPLFFRWPVLSGDCAMWALKPRLLVFDQQFPALWTCGQDDELVIHNQAFWFHCSCERLAEFRAFEWPSATKD
jgi:hypothetical protein